MGGGKSSGMHWEVAWEVIKMTMNSRNGDFKQDKLPSFYLHMHMYRFV